MSDDNPYASPDSDVTVDEPTDLAGRGLRLGGSIIDGIVSILVIVPAMFAMGYWDRAMAGEETVMDSVWLFLLGFGIFLLVNGYLLANRGQTIGKALVKTRIVSVNDEKILSFGKVLSLRYLPVWVLSVIPLVGPIFGLVNVLFIFRSDRRCVHDLIAGTKVVNA